MSALHVRRHSTFSASDMTLLSIVDFRDRLLSLIGTQAFPILKITLVPLNHRIHQHTNRVLRTPLPIRLVPRLSDQPLRIHITQLPMKVSERLSTTDLVAQDMHPTRVEPPVPLTPQIRRTLSGSQPLDRPARLGDHLLRPGGPKTPSPTKENDPPTAPPD